MHLKKIHWNFATDSLRKSFNNLPVKCSGIQSDKPKGIPTGIRIKIHLALLRNVFFYCYSDFPRDTKMHSSINNIRNFFRVPKLITPIICILPEFPYSYIFNDFFSSYSRVFSKYSYKNSTWDLHKHLF